MTNRSLPTIPEVYLRKWIKKDFRKSTCSKCSGSQGGTFRDPYRLQGTPEIFGRREQGGWNAAQSYTLWLSSFVGLWFCGRLALLVAEICTYVYSWDSSLVLITTHYQLVDYERSRAIACIALVPAGPDNPTDVEAGHRQLVYYLHELHPAPVTAYATGYAVRILWPLAL